MNGNSSFRVNTPTVSHETIDGEAVIINLDSGNYYSLTDAGSKIWSLIVAGHSVDDICRSIGDAYDGERSEIESGVQELLSLLQLESLVVSADSGESAPRARISPVSTKIERARFRGPVLQKYTDMQDLLLLDPIHDVDDMGWPRKPE
jgi:hypothetical protein